MKALLFRLCQRKLVTDFNKEIMLHSDRDTNQLCCVYRWSIQYAIAVCSLNAQFVCQPFYRLLLFE